MQTGQAYAFGPFELDGGTRRLARDGDPVALPDRQIEILSLLITNAGQVLSKDTLIAAAWKDVAVSDNSLEQAISSLRRTLGPAPDGSQYIETLARRGYRFNAAVTHSVARQDDASLERLVAPYRAFVEGRAALETLEPDAVARARDVFADVVEAAPDYAPGHIGLANAQVLSFEATRSDETPDGGALLAAGQHARDACRLDPGSGDAWSTLAVVLSRTGFSTEATAGARRAVALEPDNWRHSVRLAFVTWGEERLHAAHRALTLLPGAALAHWLAATVYVAREALEEAERELTNGTQAQKNQPEGERLGAVGLHLLLGLVRLARGSEADALREFDRELEAGPSAHVYARESCSNAWYAIGAVRLRRGQKKEAREAFAHTLDMVAGHPGALAATAALADPGQRVASKKRLDHRLTALRSHGGGVEAAVFAGVHDLWSGGGDANLIARLVHDALLAAPNRTSSGWTIPVEPLLHVSAAPGSWAAVLTTLRSSAV